MIIQRQHRPLRIIFAGTPEFAATHLQKLIRTSHHIVTVFTQPDRPSGRGNKVISSPVKMLALDHNIPVLQPCSLKTNSLAEKIRALDADIFITVAYGLLLPEAILKLPRFGCINVHGSLLPKWRGAAPIQRSCLAGDTETGISLMQMDAGLDTGDILLQVQCPIEKNDTSASLYQKLAQLGAKALPEILIKLPSGNITPQKQDDHKATYAEKLTRKEAQLNWNKTAPELEREIRAFNPWPGSWFTVNGHRIKVWESHMGTKKTEARPGAILSADKTGIHVATSNGTLVLTKLQPAGKKILSAQDLLNARQEWFQINTILSYENKG